PHLHTPCVNREKSLLFPPFPPFSPKFLKNASYLHLLKSLKPNNIITILTAPVKEFNFTKYLLSQLILSNQQPINHFPLFLPQPKHQHSQLITPPQPLQLIKHTHNSKPQLQFPTQLITSQHTSLPAL
ncbi:malate:quinone oxidoreductase, partial [Staphylococcus epidermidis]|uniref:malate:quinone oxidoreductase n=1 Tax=Staphylococcus epidermidis TaxID=1282 RepID=UPI0016429B15